MSNFNELISLCKGGVNVYVNEHYETATSVDEYIRLEECYPGADEIDPDILKEMIRKDTIVYVECYPDSDIGIVVVWHHDAELAISEALAAIKKSMEQEE